MANDTQRSFSNAIVGIPMVGADVNIFDIHATPRFAVGTGFTRQDGNQYRYGYSSAGTTSGYLVAPTLATAYKKDTSFVVVAPASAVAVPGDSILRAGDKGSRFVELTVASVSLNQFAGGYFVTEFGTGSGYTYRIKGNSATGSPASGNIRLELREPLAATVAATTVVMVAPCIWNDVVAADTVTNGVVCGVACATTTTAKPYGWFCVRGMIGAVQNGAATAGEAIILSTGSSGCWSRLAYASTLSTFSAKQQLGECVVGTTNFQNGNLGVILINLV